MSEWHSAQVCNNLAESACQRDGQPAAFPPLSIAFEAISFSDEDGNVLE